MSKKRDRKEYNHQRYLKNKEKILERHKQWREDNPNYAKQHYEENKEEILEKAKQRYEENKEEILEKAKQRYQDNKEQKTMYNKQYYQTPIGMAHCKVNNYSRLDKKHNRGECTITPEWMIDNIFNGHCIYCGKSDWAELGCDRIDNSKPHTPDNVVPCCGECNTKRGNKSYEEFLKEMRANSSPS
ncbi:MAG: hypothetical protein J6S67_09115 [Methanobrevibacter sp.]|nr:hypothetical protein [Methanobrevibacter sp.]